MDLMDFRIKLHHSLLNNCNYLVIGNTKIIEAHSSLYVQLITISLLPSTRIMFQEPIVLMVQCRAMARINYLKIYSSNIISIFHQTTLNNHHCKYKLSKSIIEILLVSKWMAIFMA